MRILRLILAISLALILGSESLAQEKAAPASPPQQPAEEGTVAKEWFGSGLPWWEWSRLTGNWGGLRMSLEDAGVTIEGSSILDVSRVAKGGIRRRWILRNLLDLQLSFDLKRLLGHEWGTLSARYYSFFGRDASTDIGDIQAFDNIDANRQRHQLAEFWYEQKLFNEIFRLKVGKVDANTEFAFVENGAEFVNSSMGYSPTIRGFASYPDPAMSVNLFVDPTEYLYVGFGVYDGAGQKGFETGSRGPSTFFRGLNKLFYIGELGAKWAISGADLPGRLGVGGWHHHGPFDRFDETRKPGTEGFYVVFDQMLWRADSAKKENKRGIGMFLQYGHADPHISGIRHHLGGGFSWTGPIPSREEDVFGWGVTWVRLSSAPGTSFVKKHELALEMFYKVKITPWLSVKPDLQYIVNPSGSQDIKNAFVPTLRFEWTF